MAVEVIGTYKCNFCSGFTAGIKCRSVLLQQYSNTRKTFPMFEMLLEQQTNNKDCNLEVLIDIWLINQQIYALKLLTSTYYLIYLTDIIVLLRNQD